MKWIADISSNFNQDIDRAFELIQKAKDIGADGVKFQLFQADKLYHSSQKEMIAKLKQRELNPEWIQKLYYYAIDINIEFGLTLFHKDNINEYSDNCDFVKIGSYETGNTDFIREILLNRDIILSTGLLTFSKIRDIYNYTMDGNITFLHCDSHYPADVGSCLFNMYMIPLMKQWFGCKVGWSDHSASMGVIESAYKNGADLIEFHLDLDDKKGFEFEHGHCWTVSKAKGMIKEIKASEEIYKKRFDERLDIELLKQRMDVDGFRPMKEIR